MNKIIGGDIIMEDFVNIELAMKLKDLGYNIPFFFYYRTDDKKLYHAMVINPLVYGKNVDAEVVIAPTIAQVLEWLRKRDIMVEIIPSLVDDGTWTFSFRIQTKKFYDRSTKDYNSYELAAFAGIEHVLNNLI
jgi:hypothetical protein